MPKKRKKNPGVGIDFKRAKLKVGKKLPQAKNATDTNFKAQSISLPGQSAFSDDRSGVPVTDRNLTIKELLSQVGHYSERIRKDALSGLCQLLPAHPQVLRSQAGAIVEKLAEHLADSDAAVRAALRDLWRDVVLPGLGPAGLAPFLPLVMAHVTSAMTHLSAAVRADALLVLNSVMAAAPQHVTGTYLLPALQHYAHLLAPSQRARSVKAGSIKSLLEVVTGLQSLLEHADSAGKHSRHSAGQEPGLSTAQHKSCRNRTLYQQRCQPAPRTLQPIHSMPLEQQLDSCCKTGVKGKAQCASAEPMEAATHALMGRLLEAWSECAPSQLSAAPEAASAACCHAILVCAIRLLDILPPGHEQRWRTGIIQKVAPHVPLGAPAVQPSAGLVSILVDINIAAAELLTRFLSLVPAGKSETWAEQLVEFYEGVLRSGLVLPSSGGLAEGMRQPSVSTEVYANILTGVGIALPAVSPSRRAAILAAVDSLASQLSASSPVLALVLSFRLSLIARPQNFYPVEGAESAFLDEGRAAAWLETLPRQLWELRSSAASTSLLMLRMLHSAGACARQGGPISAAVQRLQDQLMPCFLSVQPLQQPGKAAHKPKQNRPISGVRLVAGPLARLSSTCQEMAVDVLFYTPALAERTLQALTLVCLSPAYPPSLAQRAVSVVQHAFEAGRVQPDVYLSFLATLLVGQSSQVDGSLLDSGFGRAGPVVGSASRALQSYPDGSGAALGHIDAVLASSITPEGRSMRAMYGSMTAVLGIHDDRHAPHAQSAGVQHKSSAQLQQNLPDAALEYAAATARQSACKPGLIASAASGEGDSIAGMSHEGPGIKVLQEQLSKYPNALVYDLLAAAPQLLQPFMERLTTLACGKPQEHAAKRKASGPLSLGGNVEERLLVSLLIGQKMIQHEHLRAVLLCAQTEASDRSIILGIAGLCETVGVAGQFSSQAIAAAKQKLLSLHEIHFGAGQSMVSVA